jgi:hypothetical protein
LRHDAAVRFTHFVRSFSVSIDPPARFTDLGSSLADGGARPAMPDRFRVVAVAAASADPGRCGNTAFNHQARPVVWSLTVYYRSRNTLAEHRQHPD